ncbi:uncharacterized protein LOC110344966 [Heterocephalus glaber]|uniref:Uncharacterized protein LOC110344966 n=1 Tax=Heterocephalus glaber TaxID=10181 RepID=A0AAX6RG60_HETGA|nr:uncharacterized protein LOC110344966 [Heterocephalus glaber]
MEPERHNESSAFSWLRRNTQHSALKGREAEFGRSFSPSEAGSKAEASWQKTGGSWQRRSRERGGKAEHQPKEPSSVKTDKLKPSSKGTAEVTQSGKKKIEKIEKLEKHEKIEKVPTRKERLHLHNVTKAEKPEKVSREDFEDVPASKKAKEETEDVPSPKKQKITGGEVYWADIQKFQSCSPDSHTETAWSEGLRGGKLPPHTPVTLHMTRCVPTCTSSMMAVHTIDFMHGAAGYSPLSTRTFVFSLTKGLQYSGKASKHSTYADSNFHICEVCHVLSVRTESPRLREV